MFDQNEIMRSDGRDAATLRVGAVECAMSDRRFAIGARIATCGRVERRPRASVPDVLLGIGGALSVLE
jgi:hypothetical protein